MADIVTALLQDIGLYGQVPTTFPELIVWLTTVVVSATIIAGIIKTLFIVCLEFRRGAK